MGNRNPIAEEYETVPDELGFLISRIKEVQTECRRQFMAQPIHAATPQFIGTFLTALSFYRPIIAVIIGLN